MKISNEQEFRSWNEMTEKNRCIVLDAFEALNKGDGEGWLPSMRISSS